MALWQSTKAFSMANQPHHQSRYCFFSACAYRRRHMSLREAITRIPNCKMTSRVPWTALLSNLSHCYSLIVKCIPTLSPSPSSTLNTFDHLRIRHLKLFPTYVNFTLNSRSVFGFYIIIIITKIAGRKVRQLTGWSTQTKNGLIHLCKLNCTNIISFFFYSWFDSHWN